MIIKRIMVRYGRSRHRRCLKCNAIIKERLKDNEDYVCPECGQVHLVDVHDRFIHLTAAERPDMRQRNSGRFQ